jgi:hypothetical protein
MEGNRADSSSNVALIVALGVVALVMSSIYVALGTYVVRAYKQRSQTVEAQRIAAELASGIARCGSRGELPGSTIPVPAALALVDGAAYESKPSDWSDPVFACAGFSRSGPQYHQYQWQRLDPQQGVVIARADFDRDGVAESGVDVAVTCPGGVCNALQPKLFGASASLESSQSTASSSSKLPIGYILMILVCWLALAAGAIWTIVVAFLESVPWGFTVLILPGAWLVFTVKFWQKARAPFLLQVGSVVLMFTAGIITAFLAD